MQLFLPDTWPLPVNASLQEITSSSERVFFHYNTFIFLNTHWQINVYYHYYKVSVDRTFTLQVHPKLHSRRGPSRSSLGLLRDHSIYLLSPHFTVRRSTPPSSTQQRQSNPVLWSLCKAIRTTEAQPLFVVIKVIDWKGRCPLWEH